MANQLHCEPGLSSCTSNDYNKNDNGQVEMASPACYRGIIPNANGYADDGFDRYFEQREQIPSNTLQAEPEHDTPGSMTYSVSSEQDSCGTLKRYGMDGVAMDDDDDDDDDGFGDFEEFASPSSSIEHAVFGTMDEALDQWKIVLAKVFPPPQVYEDWVGNDMTSIRRYVLEEAHESIHSRITWTAVTHAMDDDTGVPKVRWNHSKIEDMYLSALNCKRQKDPVPLVPSTLTITGEPDRDDRDIPVSPSPPPMTAPSTFPDTHTKRQPTTPSSARSSFGFSFARFLPRLSTSSLPRSDSSAPTSASSTKRCSVESHSHISEGTGRTSPSSPLPPPSPEIASNSNPLSKPMMHNNPPATKRHSMPAPTTTTMKINTSLANQNLLDLDDDSVTISSPPAARSLFSLTPLTPTAVHYSTSTKRHTMPFSIPEYKEQDLEDDFGEFEQANTMADSTTKNHILDDFGSFTASNHSIQSDTKHHKVHTFAADNTQGQDHDDDFGEFIQSQDTTQNSNDDDWGEWSSA